MQPEVGPTRRSGESLTLRHNVGTISMIIMLMVLLLKIPSAAGDKAFSPTDPLCRAEGMFSDFGFRVARLRWDAGYFVYSALSGGTSPSGGTMHRRDSSSVSERL